ncbi:MAG: zf-HC2 domain-containing protein [candidate division Zixibacteria bacterium]|nr:zf-HC2 domain-containing protein [candidate division Zixibacteria bacterium]MCK4605783.1 zf-HC2 domain-containing protein [candidate division Zixibacteria bacterium]
MRCRKARSYLSAYCNGELDGHRKQAVREHLLTCASCRREEAIYRDMAGAAREIPGIRLSDDFNVAVLNRIGKERFAETHTRAYLPSSAPSFFWRRLAPALAMACLAVFAIVATLPTLQEDTRPAVIVSEGRTLDDSYLTVQPVTNPNLTVSLREDWSLSDQLARAERIGRISRTLAPVGRFGSWEESHELARLTSSSARPMPYVADYYLLRPVVRIYSSPRSVSENEGVHAY